MRAANPNPPASLSEERKIVLLLCWLAAVHVFIYSAAFPFFNITDEDAHFDLVVKYAHGHIPVGLETASSESARYMVLYGTREYLFAPEQLPGGKFPPPEWTQPTNETSGKLFGYKVGARMGINHENSQAPLYYTLAAIWFQAGKALGIHGGSLLFWLRLLNIFFYGRPSMAGMAGRADYFPGKFIFANRHSGSHRLHAADSLLLDQ
jgi:hypothetical protein